MKEVKKKPFKSSISFLNHQLASTNVKNLFSILSFFYCFLCIDIRSNIFFLLLFTSHLPLYRLGICCVEEKPVVDEKCVYAWKESEKEREIETRE
jgi:hypothetical protein